MKDFKKYDMDGCLIEHSFFLKIKSLKMSNEKIIERQVGRALDFCFCKTNRNLLIANVMFFTDIDDFENDFITLKISFT